MHAVAQRARGFGRAPGKPLGDPLPPPGAARHPRAKNTPRRRGGADGGAKVEQRLREIRGAIGRIGVIAEPRGGHRDFGFRGGQRRLDGEKPRHHALDIAIHRNARQAERDGADRGSGIEANPRKPTQRRVLVRETAHRGHLAGAGMEVAGASVIAEPSPGGEHVFEPCRRQRAHGREPADEARIVGYGGGYGGLLQHDLAQPHPIRVGGLAGRGAPGQHPAVTVVPGKQRRGGGDGGEEG